ncbi:MAG TPA: TetR/AcrR family transcriptional regulator [Solirubrobacteraceae bacterium]|nr:TetR/AcrR family transcriptional regulator [Solirubrobacteraceae bacterium]
MPVRTQKERSDATTSELLDVARRLFAADGYAATSLEDVVRGAGVTKGALYHHFGGKRELFLAVYEREQQRLAKIQHDAFTRKKGTWDGFFAASQAFFEASLDPGVQRITLLDAPSVLGWETMREVEGRYALVQLHQGIEALIHDGHLAPRPVEPLANMLFGSMCEAAMMVARSEDQRAATKQVLAELRTIMDALKATG